MFKAILVSILLVFSSAAVVADDPKELEQQYLEECEEYAKEDKVSAEELEAYLEECVKEIKAETAKEAEESKE